MSSRPIYRKEALDRLSSPEELDCLFTVVRLPGWALLASAGLLCLGALAWGTFGRIPEIVEGVGVLFPCDWEQEPRVRLTERPPEWAAGSGTSADDTKALLYFSPRAGRQICVGMAARVSLGARRGERGGSIRGTVKRVSAFPVTRDPTASMIGDAEFVQSLTLPDELTEVEIELERSDLARGLGRASAAPPQRIPIGARVTVADQAPLARLLAVLRSSDHGPDGVGK
jgi:hypothetical protein